MRRQCAFWRPSACRSAPTRSTCRRGHYGPHTGPRPEPDPEPGGGAAGPASTAHPRYPPRGTGGGEGWDIIHLSGHGQQGELLLEDDRGGSDTINAAELGELLDLARARLKLLILDACYSGVGSHAAAREQVGLERAAVGRRGPRERSWPRPPGRVAGPGPGLSQRLDFAALAMDTRWATPSPPS